MLEQGSGQQRLSYHSLHLVKDYINKVREALQNLFKQIPDKPHPPIFHNRSNTHQIQLFTPQQRVTGTCNERESMICRIVD